MSNLTTRDNGLLAQSIKGRKVTLADLKRARTPQTQIGNIYIAADISGSMSGSKIYELKRALKATYKPGIKVFAFSDEIYDVQETDFNMLSPTGGTRMLEALRETWDQHPRHIILITDGEPTDASPKDILYAAGNHTNVPIDTIGISEADRRGYDPVFLAELARITGGKFTDCGQPIQLTAIIQTLLIEAGGLTEKGGVVAL